MFARQQRPRQPPSPIFTEIDEELDEELEIVNQNSTELGFESNVDIVTVSDCDSGTDLEEKDMEIDDDESDDENEDENEVPPLTKYGKIDTAKLDQELENELKELK